MSEERLDTETMSVNKRVKEMPIDRLSALPDSLLIRILSFLETKQAAVTAVLSKRWQYLWTESPRLIFRERSRWKVRKCVSWVNRTLVTCTRDHLEVFVVDFDYDKRFASDVNAWVEFAVKNKVKQVGLLLNTWRNDFYVLPQLMCSNSSLKLLSIVGCTVAPQRTIDWRSLTELYIEVVEVQQAVIAKILSGCPVLSRLVLNYCWGFNCLEIKSKSPYELEICDRDHGHHGPLIEISAPYLRLLSITLYPKGRKLRLTNVPSLVRAAIDFAGSDWDLHSLEVMSNTKELFKNIHHVKVVQLGYNYIEVLSCLALNGWQFPQSTRTSLSVATAREELSISSIVGLLESSPNIETLVIVGNEIDGEPYGLSPAAKGDLDCDLLHLKTVDIKNFVDPILAGEPMLTLARIPLKRATVLEKMVIYVKEFTTSPSTLDPFKIAETLLSYPRSSQKAVVLLR